MPTPVVGAEQYSDKLRREAVAEGYERLGKLVVLNAAGVVAVKTVK